MSAKTRFNARGNWTPGVDGQFVDIKALDTFLKFLPWMLAIEAIVRGWEIMRIRGLLLNMIPTPLAPVVGEGAFGFEYFGLTLFLSGAVMIFGLSFRRFIPIVAASLLGTASYFLLSMSYAVEAFFGDSGTGLRTCITFLLIASLWIFKGFFTATKKSISDVEKEAKKSEEGIING